MFARIQIYCAGDCCFDDIQKSNKPTVIINTEHIICVDERTCMFRDNYREYPYRLVKMSTGLKFYCVLESANELVELITQDHGTVPKKWSEEDERIFSNINLYIRKAGDYPHFNKENIKDAINWLKSLRPQSTWKPSKEQIEALEKILKYFQMLNAFGETIDELKELKEQLERLME